MQPFAADTATADEQTAALAFIQRWQGNTASELSTAQSFVIQLCELLGVSAPHPTPAQDYLFERPVTFTHGDGSTSAGRIDCYRRGHFVLEAKKLKTTTTDITGKTDKKNPTGKPLRKGFDDALMRARAQAEGYARALPAAEGRPPFLLVVDVGNVIELYAEFSKSGATYTPFPDPRNHRLKLADLAHATTRALLRNIWTAPDSLNPANASARVTREVSDQLATLAKSMEQSGHRADHVAAFLTRALFSMFAEDIELLPKGSFLSLLQTHRADPPVLQRMLQALWTEMDKGGFSTALATQILKFNGKLFKESNADGYSLLLNKEQIALLTNAAKSNWREVEPAIFGTLLERALNSNERHSLGAHYTPRAYVERLVLPTVVEPLRQDWANAQAAALLLAVEAAQMEANPVIVKANTKAAQRPAREHEAKTEAKWIEARKTIKTFHHQLCNLKVLDPACGSGNFLYVTLEHLKRLEGEVLNQLAELGEATDRLGGGETVSLQQFLGLELNPQAAALAELVLWIGYLQWQIRTRGSENIAEPVVRDYGNIETRDAVLAWDDLEPAYDDNRQLLSRWDGQTHKTHPVTGRRVPDEAALVPQWQYANTRQALWPAADFIVGNPPFIGAATMRAALGDGYVQALRKAWPEVPESADFVMYWWHRAASLVAQGQVKRFGLITTNSLRQTFNRRVVQAALDARPVAASVRPELVEGLSSTAAKGKSARGAGGRRAGQSAGPALMVPNAHKSVRPNRLPGTPSPSFGGSVALAFAIPDHPWVDSSDGAAVRISMTVGARIEDFSTYDLPDLYAVGNLYAPNGRHLTVTHETPGEYGEVQVTLTEKTGQIHADLSVGANATSAVALQSNENLSNRGVQLFGKGFIVQPGEAAALGLGSETGLEAVIRQYRNGRDLTDEPRLALVIDAFGLSADQLRSRHPAVYQHLYEHVKPERDQNNRAGYRDNWWIFGEPRKVLRKQLAHLPRYIATVETAKHRTFQFLDASILPDNKLIAIALDDAFHLGVLSSRLHGDWALAAGSWLGVGNDPVYVKSRCFETFPFPDEDTGLTAELRQKISTLAEQIDAHRKRVLASAAKVPVAGLTLTGLYNVLEALKAGRELTAKEKAINSAGLVSTLKTLHDELDAAVLAAYGWSDLDDVDELLSRLVALNAQRAAEEKTGLIHWLRPGFQNDKYVNLPQNKNNNTSSSLFKDELVVQLIPEQNATITNTTNSNINKYTPMAWPNTLPDQVRAVAQVLASSPVPLSLPAVQAAFTGRASGAGARSWQTALPAILQTLEALGRARVEGAGDQALWRSA